MDFNRSSIMHSSRMSPFQSKRGRQLLQREDTMNLSPILNDTSIYKALNDTSLRRALDESSVLGGVEAGDGLNEAFFEVIQTSHSGDILDTLSRLSQTCLDSLELIDPWKRYNAENYWLAEEANTWKLLHYLYADSIKEYELSLDELPIDTLSQFNYVSMFIQCNAEVRLLTLLVNWLESCAAYQEQSTKTCAVVTGTLHWGNTLHQLLVGTSLFNKEKSKSMITCMDPDAPTRQKKVPHSDDQQEDDQLCKRVFTEIRCGKYDDAVALCVSAGQPWRAAVLRGSRLLHYTKGSNGALITQGNASRDLWKWCCLDVVNNVNENLYYRATLGILSGHLPSTLSACHGNWKDLLWAHLKVQIEVRVDKFLHEHHATAHANTTPVEVLELLETDCHTEELSLEKVFNSVHALMEGKKESHYQKCQRNLMLGLVKDIMRESLECLEEADEKLVRFLAHLTLVLREIGKDPVHDVGDKILERYVTQLIDGLVDGLVNTPELIAYYVSTLPPPTQIALYADLMDRVVDRVSRKGVVEAGLKAGVDVPAAARVAIKKAITNISECYGDFEVTTSKVVAIEKDVIVIKIISSLEWLSLLPEQLEDPLWLSNAMIRTFLFMGNSEAASSIIIKLNELFPKLLSNVDTKSSELREHLCLKAYLDALESFAVWHRHFISGQPKEIEPLDSDATFSDKVLHEQRVAQFEQQKMRWQNAVQSMSSQTKNMLYSILRFPGGWLVDDSDSISSPNFSESDNEERAKQLEALRNLCIPEIVLLILKILQSGKDVESHKEALQLSDLIASENRCLYKVFSKEKLIQFIDRLKSSSLLLLEKGRDMFGYELNNE